ncbi:MAG: DNA polymerase III subunit chi [Rhodoferax sp.]|uniref:DNA polymerase III subunit chi n=1 Tax=Rhodoferax sp. TaxID=50421 RepID=UPI0013FF2C14|nr:DNA polymerase III subunit chi [Rhodoferax sp.]NDP40512.1 DNA polymerase III subunit chi [Rhodoferax sp.]
MTEVAFHFNAPDRLAYVCRLLRKAVASGAKLVVTGSPDELQHLDRALWTFSPVDFLPHCFLDSESYVVAASPVILSTTTVAVPHRQVLINLGQFVPDGFERFERVIEVVGLDDEDRQSARSRWKQYADLGYAITRHDLALKALN